MNGGGLRGGAMTNGRGCEGRVDIGVCTRVAQLFVGVCCPVILGAGPCLVVLVGVCGCAIGMERCLCVFRGRTDNGCARSRRLVRMVIPSAKSSAVCESSLVSSSESECKDERSDVKEKCPDECEISVLREYFQSSSGCVLMAEDRGERIENSCMLAVGIAGRLEGSGKI